MNQKMTNMVHTRLLAVGAELGDRGVLSWAATRPNTQVIYKMRPGIFLKAYAVHRIENVNQGCPSPLLLLQLQPVWKLSTGLTSLG